MIFGVHIIHILFFILGQRFSCSLNSHIVLPNYVDVWAYNGYHILSTYSTLFKHVSFQYAFLKPHLPTYHSHIDVLMNNVIGLGTSTSMSQPMLDQCKVRGSSNGHVFPAPTSHRNTQYMQYDCGTQIVHVATFLIIFGALWISYSSF